MADLHIPDALDQSAQRVADQLGWNKEDFVQDAIARQIAEYDEDPELTEAQIARIHEGIAQLSRGEFITSEEVDAKFEKLFQELEARAEVEEQRAASRA